MGKRITDEYPIATYNKGGNVNEKESYAVPADGREV